MNLITRSAILLSIAGCFPSGQGGEGTSSATRSSDTSAASDPTDNEVTAPTTNTPATSGTDLSTMTSSTETVPMDLGTEKMDLGTEKMDLGIDKMDLGSTKFDLGAPTYPMCGDGLSPGEDCDRPDCLDETIDSPSKFYSCIKQSNCLVPCKWDWMNNMFDCDPYFGTCDPAICQDHQVNQLTEECDDGNSKNGDGCSSSCTEEFIIFVTSGEFPGDINFQPKEMPNTPPQKGYMGADDACHHAAIQGGLWMGLKPGDVEYRALLSTESIQAISRVPPITMNKRPVLRSGDTVFDENDADKAFKDLFVSPQALYRFISIDEFGSSVTGYAWTGTNALGQPTPGATCNSWDSNVGDATIGNITQTSIKWIYDVSEDAAQHYTCKAMNRIYCFRAK